MSFAMFALQAEVGLFWSAIVLGVLFVASIGVPLYLGGRDLDVSIWDRTPEYLWALEREPEDEGARPRGIEEGEGRRQEAEFTGSFFCIPVSRASGG